MTARRDGPLSNALVRGACVVLAAASLATLLITAGNDLPPGHAATSFGLVFWRWLAMLHASVVALLVLAAWGVGRVVRRPGLPDLAVRAAAFAVLALAAVNFRFVSDLAVVGGPVRTVWLTWAGSACALSCLVLVAATRRPWLPALIALAACIASLGAQWPAARAAATPFALPAVRVVAPPLLVVGIDGADWSYVDPLIERGELPHLAALKARGAWARLGTLRPTESPVVWTTIATGVPPAQHGIRGFAVERLDGVDEPLPELRAPEGFGFAWLLRRARKRRLIDDHAVDTTLRRVPALWNVAASEGSPLALVNWWVTWPAEPVLGYVVSEKLYYRPSHASRLTYPESLTAELLPLARHESDIGIEDLRRFRPVSAEEWARIQAGRAPPKSFEAQFRYFVATHETDGIVARHLIERGRHDFGATVDLLVLLRIVDMVSHTSLATSELVSDHLGADPNEVAVSAGVVGRAYQAADEVLGSLMDDFGPDANVVVVSDHGFQREQPWPDRPPYYGHNLAPPGILVGAGPAFRAGPVDGVDVYDVLPLLACLKGLPIAMDLPGRLPEALLDPDWLAAHSPRTVPDYASVGVPAQSAAPMDDTEMLDHLRALGYLQ